MAEKTLGGDRLGSGSSMKQELHNYGMNSFNQGRDWKSTMAPGILYPCFKEIGTNFGTFDIDIDTFVRTLPTKGPLFGSFKMQVDLFNVPFRLYQGILHNNPVDIGLNMHQVYLPALVYSTIDGKNAPRVKGSNEDDEQVSTSSLIKYLGISGAGHHANYENRAVTISRKFQCVPELGYYDIFKNYYSNKQEEKAYVITPGTIKEIGLQFENTSYGTINDDEDEIDIRGFTTNPNATIRIKFNRDYSLSTELSIYYIDTNNQEQVSTLNIESLINNDFATINEDNSINIRVNEWVDPRIDGTVQRITIDNREENPEYTADIQLTPFALKNIDKMRAKLLANNELGDQVIIEYGTDDTNIWGTDSGVDGTGMPYAALANVTEEGISWNAFIQNGLVVKTYQSDLFNNWLDNSLVSEISRRTKIDTTGGGFTPDTLILQEKIYKLLNRIIVGGGTYYDWQEATYGEGVARMCEIPMYIGGMSTEIMFEEVVNNSASSADGKYQALGSLGGKGMNTGKKGGNNIHVRMDEPGYIIGIVSITPRISVSQGNDWDRTEIITMDDIHKPELDGIGFQDLMAEQMCWWNTVVAPGGSGLVHRDAVGKQTAWINYQTALDKVYGDFAKPDGYSFMVLSRNYEHDGIFGIKDMTTYIDPAKYNYAFAYQDLAAQNFWVQLNFKCVSRRKMGAQQLPTL